MSGERSLLVKAPQRRRGNRPEFGLLLSMVMTAWAIEFIDFVLPLELDRFGIIPRELSGLPGIFFSPWLHGDWQHLIANTLTFFGLGLIVLVAEGKRFLSTTFVLVLISGLGTWIIGRENSVHIGASGLIYGYFGYILGRAIWEGRLSWIVIGIVVATIYGGMIWGIRPTNSPISWEGHLAGLLVGGWLGKQHAGRRKRR